MEKEIELIAEIYDAAVDPKRWLTVMRNMAYLLQTDCAVLSARDLLNPDYTLFFPYGISSDLLHEFQENFLEQEVEFMAQRWMKNIPIGQPSYGHAYFGSAAGYQQAAGDYGDLLRRHGIHHQMLLGCEVTDFRMAGIGLNNGTAFFPYVEKALANLSPHIRRAVHIHRQLSAVQRENELLYAALNNLDTGVILVDAQGIIRFANKKLEKLLRHNPSLGIRRHCLHSQDQAENTKLQALIKEAIATSNRESTGGCGGVIGIRGKDKPTPLMLSVTPLSALETYQDLRSDHIAAAIFLSDPDADIHISDHLLRDNFQLTPREIEICQYYVNSPIIENLVASTGLTLSSLRSIIRTIYEKTGQHSQAGLLKLLMGMRTDFEHIL